MKKILTLLCFCIILMATSVGTNDGSLYVGGNANGVGTGVPVTSASVNINYSSAATLQLVAAASNKSIYVTHVHIVASGTTNVSLVYGTQTSTPCDTGQATLDGPMDLTAQTGFASGIGFGAVELVPAGNALCLTNSQAIQVGGVLSYSQY